VVFSNNVVWGATALTSQASDAATSAMLNGDNK
jgi:hypothetical protein